MRESPALCRLGSIIRSLNDEMLAQGIQDRDWGSVVSCGVAVAECFAGAVLVAAATGLPVFLLGGIPCAGIAYYSAAAD
jgi:pseudouridine-5'-phosphate glycosidase